MRSAVVDATGKVVNVIVADPQKDSAPDGMTLVAIPDGEHGDQRYLWSARDGFVPGPELAAQRALDADPQYQAAQRAIREEELRRSGR